MPRSQAQKQADHAARTSAASAVETTMATLLTQLSTYLAAGSGDRASARRATVDWIHWRLSTVGLCDAPGFPHKALSTLDHELAND